MPLFRVFSRALLRESILDCARSVIHTIARQAAVSFETHEKLGYRKQTETP